MRSCRPRSRGAPRPNSTSQKHNPRQMAPRDARAAKGTSPHIQAPRHQTDDWQPAREGPTKEQRSTSRGRPSRTDEQATEAKAGMRHRDNQRGAHATTLPTSAISSRAIALEPLATKHLEVTKHPSNGAQTTNKQYKRRESEREREEKRERRCEGEREERREREIGT